VIAVRRDERLDRMDAADRYKIAQRQWEKSAI
jgi:hypothetical protein